MFKIRQFRYRTNNIVGKPASLEDETNPDWAPCLKLGYDRLGVSDSQSVARYARAQARRNNKRQLEKDEEAAVLAVPVMESEGVIIDETGNMM